MFAAATPSTPSGESAVLSPGDVVADHRIEHLIGRGGMGAVYAATQLSLDRRVALKLIAGHLGEDPDFRERFRAEARAAAAVEHPCLLPVYAVGELEGGELYISMRLVAGGDLETRLRAGGPLGRAETLAIFGQLAEALDAAHAAGFVHRDVKPANVLLDGAGPGARTYLTDFGLAKLAAPGLKNTETGRILGSIDYIAPEQVQGSEIDSRVDVYAFGGTLYRAITGRVPYPREHPAAKLIAHRDDPVPVPSEHAPGLDPAFDRAVAWAMRKDRRDRALSAGEVMNRLREELASGSIDLGGESATEAHPAPASSRPPASATSEPTVGYENPTRRLGGPAEPSGDRLTPALRWALVIVALGLIFLVTYAIGRSIT